MNEEFDVVVCGTGLTECILSGLLSVHGKRVLHVDRNPYYGGDSASLNLTNLYEKFKPGVKPPAEYGANRDWNVDLIPKFLMACGQLVKLLLHTKVTRYLEFQVIEGSFVYQVQRPLFGATKYIHKVPATDMEALNSPLMSFFEKTRCKNFLQFAATWKDSDSSTHKGFDRNKTTAAAVFEHFGLQESTIEFIGHAIALYTNDEYLTKPFGVTLDKIKLYMYSIQRYGKSPFIYPVYGLGGLPEGFSRLCAIHGGTFMLNKPIEGFVYGNDGKVCGVKSIDGEVAKCKMVVCDPSYVAPSKIRVVNKVIRCVCILSKPIRETEGRTSCQIIIPQKQLKRRNDVYITTVSWSHGVAQKGRYVALISTTVETADPMAEIQPALSLLGEQEEKFPTFVQVSDLYVPIDDGRQDNVFVSKSYDATSHFETAADDVLALWERMMGTPLDMTITADPEDLAEDR